MRAPWPVVLLLAGCSPAAVGAEEPAKLRWEKEGLAALPAAAGTAREAGKRLLLGLSGSPT
jgi:hypothetical protein